MAARSSGGDGQSTKFSTTPAVKLTEVEKSEAAEELLRSAISTTRAFDTLTPALREMAIRVFDRKKCATGEKVVTADSKWDYFCVVETGKCETNSQRAGFVVEELGPGATFGEMALYESSPGQPLVVKGHSIECVAGGVIYRLSFRAFQELRSRVVHEHHEEDLASFLASHRLAAKALPSLFPEADRINHFAQLTEYAYEHSSCTFLIKAGELTLMVKRADDRLACRSVTFKRGEMVAASLIIGWAEARISGTVIPPYMSIMCLQPEVLDRSPRPMAREATIQYPRKVMSAVELFLDFTSEELTSLLDQGELMKFQQGELIFEEGKPSQFPCLFIVIQGTARAWRHKASVDNEMAEDGVELAVNTASRSRSGSFSNVEARHIDDPSQTTVGFFEIGDHLGASSILYERSESRSLSVEAASPLEVLALSREAFGPLLDRVVRKLTRLISVRQKIKTRGKVAVTDLGKGQLIGQGSFGKVRLGTHEASGLAYAVKVVDKSKLLSSSDLVLQTVSERSLLSTCNHSFLLRLVSASQSASQLFYVTELVLGGELYSQLQEKGKFSIPAAQFYGANVICAYAYLKQINVVYRDLKPENILVDADGFLKIIDFGFAKIVDERTFTFCGSPEYMAPEILMHRGQDLSVDMWQFGVFLFEMLVGQTAFNKDTATEIYRAILEHGRKDRSQVAYPWFFDSNAKSLIELLLSPNSTKRPTPADVATHPFFNGIDFVQLEERKVDPATVPFVPTIENEYDTSNFEELEDDSDSDDEEEIEQEQAPNTRGSRRGSKGALPNTGQFSGFDYILGWRGAPTLN